MEQTWLVTWHKPSNSSWSLKQAQEIYILVNHINIEVNMIRNIAQKLNSRWSTPSRSIGKLDWKKKVYFALKKIELMLMMEKKHAGMRHFYKG